MYKERNSLLIADHYNSHDNLNCVVIVKSNYFILTVVVFTDKLLPGSDNIAIDLSKGIIIETWAMLNKYSHLLNLFLIAQGVATFQLAETLA
jgi:hypothetical protein